MLLGIDCSIWQGNISADLKGCSFAMARASIGGDSDASYPSHLAQIKAEGLVHIAYHYLLPPGPGVGRQIGVFLDTCSDAEMLALDVESSALRYRSAISAFFIDIRKMDKKKRPVLLYSSQGTWPGSFGQDGNWVANYVHEPTIPWQFWQRDSHGIDHDVFYGTCDQLLNLARPR